jgi:hypothetical protein
MICGSPGMLKDLKHLLETRGFNRRQHHQAGRLRDRAACDNEIDPHACQSD